MSSRRARPRPLASAPSDSRAAHVQRLRRRLLSAGWPRLQMLIIVVLTSGAGLLGSFLLLRSGIDSMGLRYGLAVAIAYLVFLALLWIWLRTDSNDYIDFPNMPSSNSSSCPTHDREARIDMPTVDLPSPSSKASPASSLGDVGIGDALGSADEAALPLALLIGLLIALAALAAVLVNVVWSAPVLFAELLFDGVLAAALYRRLRREDSRHWLETAVRRTIWPFAIALALVSATGFVLQQLYPDAVTLGQVLAAG